MPFYPGPANGTTWTGPYTPPTALLTPGDLPQSLIVTADGATSAALLNKASIAVCLASPQFEVGQSRQITLSGVFSGAPGTFEIDWQSADIDADGNYVAESTTITTVNSNQAFHVSLSVKARFGRFFFKTFPNNVSAILNVAM